MASPRVTRGSHSSAMLGRGVLGDHPTHQGSQQLNVAGVEVAIGDLLDDDPGRGAALAEAAIFFRKVDTDQPEIAHFLEHRAVDAVLPGAFLVVRSELLPRKSCCGLSKRLLLLAERVVHDDFPANKADGLHSARFLSSLTNVRNSAIVSLADDQPFRNVGLSKSVVAAQGWPNDFAQPDDHGLDAYPPRYGGERVAQDGGVSRRTGQGRGRPDHHRRLRAEHRGPDRARRTDPDRACAGAGIAARHRGGSPA